MKILTHVQETTSINCRLFYEEGGKQFRLTVQTIAMLYHSGIPEEEEEINNGIG